MKFTSFKETNKIFGAGNNPNTNDLPVCVATRPIDEGVPTIISKFKLDEDELNRIKETGEIWITILGSGMPPIGLTVYDPFKDHGYKPIDFENLNN